MTVRGPLIRSAVWRVRSSVAGVANRTTRSNRRAATNDRTGPILSPPSTADAAYGSLNPVKVKSILTETAILTAPRHLLRL